ALLQAPLSIPQRGNVPDGGKDDVKEGTSELNESVGTRKRDYSANPSLRIYPSTNTTFGARPQIKLKLKTPTLERAMSPTGERRDERRNIRTRQNPLGPQEERQTRISKAIILANPSLRIHPSNNITFGVRPQIKLKLKTPRKYNESRLVDHARFNDETGNANHSDEIINGESIPIYSFIVLKIFIYDGLSEIAAIANILMTAPASTVQLLHKIVNDEPYSKSSRKELKKFTGFPQNYDIEARKDKILKDFTKTELITVCTILGLNCAGSAKELSEHIFKNLSDLACLKIIFTEQLTDDEDSAPFSLESTNDANKQPSPRQFITCPLGRMFLFPPLKHNEIKAKEGTKRMYSC
ncbi:hypothetical protein TNCV_2637941, partial [Trichonephila clavipes]